MLDKNLVRLELGLGLGLGLGLVNFQLRLSILFQLQKKGIYQADDYFYFW